MFCCLPCLNDADGGMSRRGKFSNHVLRGTPVELMLILIAISVIQGYKGC